MNQIVEALRGHAKWVRNYAASPSTYIKPSCSAETFDHAADEIERLRKERDATTRTLWLIVNSNGGYTLERADAENYPGDERAWMETATDANGDMTFRAFIHQQSQQTEK